MVMIKKIKGRHLLVRSHTKSNRRGDLLVPDDHEFKVHVRGFGDYGYIHMGGKFMIYVPIKFIGKKVRLVMEEII